MMQLTEAGLIYRWKEDEMEKLRKGRKRISNVKGATPEAISLTHLQAAFFMLGIGLTISSIAFGTEKCWSYHLEKNLRPHH